jgi:putative aminopeptidase FrvX
VKKPKSDEPAAPAPVPLSDTDRALLLELLALPGPAGEEGHIAAFLEGYIGESGVGANLTRVQDNLIALRGTPRTAIFAHTDTIGFTLGYGGKLLPIGGPHPKDRDALRCTAPANLTGRVRLNEGRSGKGRRPAGGEGAGPRLSRVEGGEAAPGTRWVYAAAPEIDDKKNRITSPYLDNRAGVWAALRVLLRCENVAVAFTAGEEQHGHGARVCAETLYRDHGVTQALIADITWDTDDTPLGKGVVVSLRDAYCPRQSFLDRVLGIADSSGIPHQREVQGAGSSDGGHILRSSVPMDWVFVGAPEKRPHTAREQASLADLAAMTDLLALLVEKL